MALEFLNLYLKLLVRFSILHMLIGGLYLYEWPLCLLFSLQCLSLFTVHKRSLHMRDLNQLYILTVNIISYFLQGFIYCYFGGDMLILCNQICQYFSL